MKKIAVLTGAGISAESGISTFRDSNGLWEQYNVEDVASIEGWYKNPQLMLKFYNERRSQLKNAQPNEAHKILAELEKYFDITIVTQNIDNLHERAGSSHIIHLHGELTKARSVADEDTIYDIGYNDIKWGDKDKNGSQLRPHIVWFGEAVPMLSAAAAVISKADIMIVVGTSLNVYPAAGLVNYAKHGAPIFLIDPKDVPVRVPNLTFIKEKATVGMKTVREILLEKYCEK